jgi:hypothetical protein
MGRPEASGATQKRGTIPDSGRSPVEGPISERSWTMKLKYLLSGVAVAALVVIPVAQVGLPLGTTAVQAQEANV